MCNTLIDGDEKHLTAQSTTATYAAFTGWILVCGLDAVRAVYRIRAMTGSFQYQLAYQTATCRTDNPDAWNTLDTLRTTAGELCTGDISVTSATANKFFIRFGIMYNLPSAPATAQADVGLQVTYNTFGALAGSGIYQLLAPDTGFYYQAVTPWMPVIVGAKHRAAFISSVTSSANLKFRVAYQTATTNTSLPNAWATDDTDHSGDGEACTSDITPSGGTASVMWIRFGLRFAMSSGTNGTGNVSIAIGARS